MACPCLKVALIQVPKVIVACHPCCEYMFTRSDASEVLTMTMASSATDKGKGPRTDIVHVSPLGYAAHITYSTDGGDQQSGGQAADKARSKPLLPHVPEPRASNTTPAKGTAAPAVQTMRMS